MGRFSSYNSFVLRSKLFFFTGMTFVPAIIEELIFRGAILAACVNVPAFVLVIISATAFAALHMLHSLKLYGLLRSAQRFAFALGTGLLFSVLAILSGSILPAVLLHTASNLLMLILGAEHLMLYIDPGTGFMLFTVITSLLSAAVYSIRVFILKMRTRIGGKAKIDDKKLPLVIFSDNKRYWNIFEPICRELQKREKPVLYLTGSEDDPAFSCSLENVTAEHVGSGNQMFNRLNNLNAYIVLSTTPGLEVYQWKRSANVSWYVHIPHAASEVILYRMFGLDYYDAVLLSGQYQADDIRALESLRNLPPKELKMIGIPYMDEMAKRLAFADLTDASKKSDKDLTSTYKFCDVSNASACNRTVLLAPSWGKSALFGVYGGQIIDALLKTGYHVIVRPHPQSFQSEKELMDKLMKEYPQSEVLEWNRDTDNFDVLNRSDILISDFSGVIFDFTLIYDKPVIYTDPDFDLAPYDAWWLKKELWTASALPRLGKALTEDNMKDIKSVIDECIEDPRYTEGRREVKNETWQNAGRGAVLAADYLVSKYDELVKEAVLQ